MLDPGNIRMTETQRATRRRIYLSPPDVEATERRLLNEAFDSNWIAPLGPFVEKFEEALSARMESRPVVSLSSGTAAIHLALIELGVQRGDCVLAQSFTFCASANPISYLGAEPVFVGSEPGTWNMCPESLETAIKALIAVGRVPKAIIFVHLYGVPAKIDELVALSSRYQIPLVEDAAESLGSTYKSRPTGTFGKFGVLSFNGNKIITTSGGGALVCSDRDGYGSVKHLATQAREPVPYYLHERIGYNYRLSNLCAAIGVGQLESLDSKIAKRRSLYKKYRESLEDLIDFPSSIPGNFENRWLTVGILRPNFTSKISSLELIQRLEEFNIECRPLWKPLHTQPVFKDAKYFGSETETKLFADGICLPSGSSLDEQDQNFVMSSIRKIAGC